MNKVKLFFIKHYKKLIALVLVLAIVLVASKMLTGKADYQEISKSETTLLTKKDFVNSINETGKANSENTSNVYPEKQLPVKEINVKVGDKVKVEDVIATLDDSSIKQQIEQKQAIINSTNKNAGVQIKTSRDRLNEALRNLQNGTNPQIVSSEQAVQNALDAWQNAEKTYENFADSIYSGYNEQIVSQDASDVNLRNTQDSSVQSYVHAQERLDRLGDTIINSRNLSNQKNIELSDLKSRETYLTKRISDLQRNIELANNYKPEDPVDPILRQRLTLAEGNLVGKQSELTLAEGRRGTFQDTNEANNNEILISTLLIDISTLENEIANLKNQINMEMAQVSNVNPHGDPILMARELESLQLENQELKERIATVSSEIQKYDSEVEQSENSIPGLVEQIEQARLQLETNKRNINSATQQKHSTSKNMENTLEGHRKNADDLKKAYEMAKKNLGVSKIAANDEINSLRNSLNSAAASGDNSTNFVDMKYLQEDLEKTVITSQLEGTITAVNMIEGQVPTSHVAVIETLDRLVIDTKVKEFDINRVRVGMPVEITSDAVGKDKVAKGVIESIDPTPINSVPSTSNTQNTQSNEVSYGVKIGIRDNIDAIKPGMNVRVKYIIEQKNQVYVVPNNAVYEKNNKSFVLTLEDKEIDTIKEMEVDVLSYNDFETVISSESLNDNLRIVNSPDIYSNGTTVQLVERVESEVQ